jgi:20S proteasome alpha/beta subunit
MNFQTEHIETDSYEKLKSMTTIITIKWSNDIVIISDSQATSNSTKNTQVSKIFKINDSIGMGTAGDERHIRVLVNDFQEHIKAVDLESEKKLRERIRERLLKLHEIYNVQRSSIEKIPTKYFFLLYALLGAKLNNGEFSLYDITPEPWVRPIDNYHIIESGSLLANLVLTQQGRISKLENKKLSDLSLNFNV